MRELTVPRELEDPPAKRVVERRREQPVPEADVVLDGPALDRLARDGELRAAADGDDVGDGGRPRHQLAPRLLVDALGGGRAVVRVVLVLDGSDLRRAPDDPDAAEVDVAGLAQVRQAEVAQRRQGVVVRVVVVPREPRRVDEHQVRGQLLVRVDDVRQVHHGLAALVRRHRQRSAGVVHHVPVRAPLR